MTLKSLPAIAVLGFSLSAVSSDQARLELGLRIEPITKNQAYALVVKESEFMNRALPPLIPEAPAEPSEPPAPVKQPAPIEEPRQPKPSKRSVAPIAPSKPVDPPPAAQAEPEPSSEKQTEDAGLPPAAEPPTFNVPAPQIDPIESAAPANEAPTKPFRPKRQDWMP